MTSQREENFLSVPACPFRRVSFGTAHCTISTDSHVSDIDPLTCLNCEVPGIIEQPRCRYLSLGTELKPYRGEGKLVNAMACRALNVRLYSLKTCDDCPLYSETTSLVEVLKEDQQSAEINLPLSKELVAQLARDIKLDYGVREAEEPPLLPIRCWRFPEGYCRKFPVYTAHKVTVLLKHNDSNNEVYRSAIMPALKELNLQVYRIDEELVSDEEMCRVCENLQESDFAIFNLDDWSSSSVFLAGILYGIGRRVALLKNASLQPVPLIEQMEHDVVRYQSIGELQERLLAHFMPYVKPTEDEGDSRAD